MGMANKALTQRARELRNNMTPQERKLWYEFLRDRPEHFQRQKVMGHYIVDFYSASAKLVIEIDGGQHFEPESMQYDENRTDYLARNFGVKVVRVDNHEINTNFDGVCEFLIKTIEESLQKIAPPAQ